MMRKWQKVTAVTTASAMTLQLAACGTEELTTQEETPAAVTYETESVEVEETNNEMYDENGELIDLYDSDYADACDDWYEDEDGSYVCEDESSPYYQNHFFDGLMYATIGAMVASSYYKNKNKVNGTYYKREDNASGGGGSSYTGSSSSNNKNNVNLSKPATDQTNNKTNNNASKGTEGTTSKPSNGASTYSSGKSGFSSGGASRGGSSSS